MINWLRGLFENNKVVETGKARKGRVLLSASQKANLVTDILINEMRYKDVANKYNISVSTVYQVLKKARSSRS